MSHSNFFLQVGNYVAMLLHILIEWTYTTRRMDAILAITKVAIFQ